MNTAVETSRTIRCFELCVTHQQIQCKNYRILSCFSSATVLLHACSFLTVGNVIISNSPSSRFHLPLNPNGSLSCGPSPPISLPISSPSSLSLLWPQYDSLSPAWKRIALTHEVLLYTLPLRWVHPFSTEIQVSYINANQVLEMQHLSLSLNGSKLKKGT